MRHLVPLACLLSVLTLCLTPSLGAEEDDPPKLLGRCTPAQLQEEPFDEWFRKEHDGYTPDAGVMERLRHAGLDSLHFKVFFGTWCGDSRREVPRLLKLLEVAGVRPDRVQLVAVDSADELHKRSPGGEERGLEIYRVPTVIVQRDGLEVNRVVEHPVLSLERDLLAILSGNHYQPSYRSYPEIRRWLREGLLADENVTPYGLAGEIRHLVSGEPELAAVGRVLMTRGDLHEGVKVFQVACALHAESASSFRRLAEAWKRVGEVEKSRHAAARALRLSNDREEVDALVDILVSTDE